MDVVPCSSMLAAAGYQHVRMYDIEQSNPNPVINYGNVTKNITSLGFQEDGHWMYTGGEDGRCRIWDLRVRNATNQRQHDVESPINTCQLHPNQTEIYIGDQSGRILLFDLRKDEKILRSTKVDDVSILNLSIDPDGTCLAAVDNSGNCYMLSFCVDYVKLNCDPLKRRLKLPAHKRFALKCKFSPDSTLLATTSADKTAKIWRTADLLPLLKKAKDSSDLSTASSWPLSESVSPIAELKTPAQRWVWDLAFSADSQYVVTGIKRVMTYLANLLTISVYYNSIFR